jgi:hypothetical protein
MLAGDFYSRVSVQRDVCLFAVELWADSGMRRVLATLLLLLLLLPG